MVVATPSREEVARTLLVELLAYQFAFPVRWIETQDVLLKDAKSAQRVIEIGPTQVLAQIAKETASRTLGLQDQLGSVQREFLFHGKDVDRILYNYSQSDASEPTPKSPISPPPTAPVAANTPAAEQPTSPPIPPPSQPSAPPAAVEDRPCTGLHVLTAIVGQKLKLVFDELPLTTSIRELSKGRSTLQNELIGDISAEFTTLPDGAEDLPLEALGAALSSKFSGQLGKHSMALVTKLISAKMPGGFNSTAIKSYLEEHWHLPKGHQTTVLCLSLTLEPSSRLVDEAAAKAWLDSVVGRYASFTQLQLQPGAALGSAMQPSQSATVDTKSLEVAKEEQRKFMRDQFNILAKHLKDDSSFGKEQTDELLAALEEAEAKLGRWSLEFDETFFNGIAPIFDAEKSRVYDSSWSWARQDVIKLLHGIVTGTFAQDTTEGAELLLSIQNRLDATSQAILHANEELLSRCGLGDLLLSNAAESPRFTYKASPLGPSTTILESGEIKYEETPRSESNDVTYAQLVRQGPSDSADSLPFAHIRSKKQGNWSYNPDHTRLFLDSLAQGTSGGLSFSGKTVLITGAGPGSIGADIAKGLLQGGASVIVTTSREPSASAHLYQKMYQDFGARGSSLKVLPMNAASRNDIDNLVDYIFSKASVIDNVDFIVPFAAIPQAGQIDGLNGKSELAHRAMLVNVLRLLGAFKKQKQRLHAFGQPTNVLVPLSPNHGTFGGDGLYGESKLGLETLFNRCQSEDWLDFVTITGVVIGWTRGTGLMSANNMTAAAIEEHGVMTFSQSEMAFNILCLMTRDMSQLADDEPIYADLTGGLHSIPNLKEILSTARADILRESGTRKALVAQNALDASASAPNKSSRSTRQRNRLSRVRPSLSFPKLDGYSTMTRGIDDLQGMVDLERTIVVVGYSELGPWGNARTRWDMESTGKLGQSALFEMAWMMGLIKHHRGDMNGQFHSGWVDAETQEPVADGDLASRYEQKILQHAGLRFIEPEGLGDNTDPLRKEFMQEIVLDEDLPPFQTSRELAESFVRRHGQLATITPLADSDDCTVHIKAGAQLMVPKAVESDRFVAGQLPRGWDAARYGIPAEIVSQVDPVVLYALCCLSEAVLMAGLEDPLELYKHIHVSELANCLGTGAGSLLAMRGIYKDRLHDKSVQNDILQESYLNAMGAWSNMLYLASSGPIKTPTGTCATAVESLDTGCEAIKSGKVKVAIVGGSDDFQEEMAYEFGNMKATCNTRDELRKGRKPSEMSRPTASSRAGFVESAGCGVQLIMRADLAIQMGLPVYGIVGYTHMAGDKVGRSVPAPGQGILTAAKESSYSDKSPLLDLGYRRQMLTSQLNMIQASLNMQTDMLEKSGCSETQIANATAAARAAAQDARYMWSNEIRKQDPGISPIRAALATWDLKVDDLSVASFHGTSTVANEKNESDVVNTQMRHLGRSPGNPLLVICQKYLTGHTKGAAGALMLNGGLQVMQSGLVPGNRNADNIDSALQQHEHLVFGSEAIQTAGVRAFMLTSFGFGQKGGLVIVIHPRHLFAAIDEDRYNRYSKAVSQRKMRADARFARGLVSQSLFQAKTNSPWEAAGEQRVFLDPDARLPSDGTDALAFDAKQLHHVAPGTTDELMEPFQIGSQSSSSAVGTWLRDSLADAQGVAGVGIDTEDINSVPSSNATFVNRNFTPLEQEYCQGTPDRRASYAGRWVAKEAVFKSLQTASYGGGASMDEIEISPDDDKVPRVTLHGRAKDAAEARGITRVEVSISHSEGRAMAVAASLYA